MYLLTLVFVSDLFEQIWKENLGCSNNLNFFSQNQMPAISFLICQILGFMFSVIFPHCLWVVRTFSQKERSFYYIWQPKHSFLSKTQTGKKKRNILTSLSLQMYWIRNKLNFCDCCFISLYWSSEAPSR